MTNTSKLSRTYDAWLLLLLVLCSISTIFVVVTGCNPTLMIASFLYLLLLRLKNLKTSLLRIDFVTIFIVFYSTIRYFVYPFFFCIEASEVFYSRPFAIDATILFLVEELTVLLAVNWGLKNINQMPSVNLGVSKTNGWIIVLMSIASVLLIYQYPTVGENYQFIWNLNVSSIEGTDFGSIAESLSYVLIDATRLLLPLVLINICYGAYNKRKDSKYIFLSFASCLLPMLIIKNMNRGSSFFTSLIYLWIVVQLYGWKKSKRYTMETVGGIAILLIIVSLVKHATGIENEGYTIGYFYTMLQSYTLGIESVRIGLETNYVYSNINPFVVLYNDVVGSLPILNKYTVMTMRYSTFYNEMYYAGSTNKNDCIAPLVTNLIYCFGYIAAIIPAYIFKKAVVFYRKAFTAKSINSVFLMVYTSVVLASSTGSLSATVATLVWVVLPLAFIIKIINIINGK